VPEASAQPSAPRGPKGLPQASSGRRGRRKGVDIKPGTVKQARREAGLSLAQVAGDEISRTAIYFVETGKAKPSMETLRLIADRTGRPLDFFLVGRAATEVNVTLGTTDLERLITTGDAAGAISAGERLLELQPDAGTAARTRHLIATAYLRLAQPVMGRRYAAAARAYFEQAGDLLMTAECLGTEASAAYLAQDPSALALAEGALATARSLPYVPQSTESRLLAILAGVHATNRNWQAAIETYERAIAVGDVVQDLRRLSLTYAGLSLAHQELGELGQAAHYAHRALALHETLSDRISLARSENNLGLLLFQHGELDKAETHVRTALRIFEELRVEQGRAHILLSLCELSLARSAYAEAEGYAASALDFATRMGETTSIGESHMWLGRTAAARGDGDAADAEFTLAFDSLGGPRKDEHLVRVHALYAEILEARGDLAGANRHLKEALRASHSAAVAVSDSRAATA
jgi:tetratricopeptide (TPR) repeat protein/DNA-binding XRE family transcriptional regulator